MTAAAQSVIECTDGTQIPVTWVYPDAPQYEWLREQEHWPEPLTPMDLWIWHNGAPGGDRAWDELGLEAPVMFSRFQTAGPYLYVRVTMPPLEEMMKNVPPILAVSAKYGGAAGLWETHGTPRIQRACDELAAMDASADLRVAAETLFYGFHQTFTCLVLFFLPNMQLTALLTEYGIDDPELVAHELTQGGENATQMVDEEIWRLAELARATPAVRDILTSPGDGGLPALRGEPDASKFLAEFDAMIERHGRRSQGWMLSAETWGERPEAALALVRAQVAADRISPDELRERTARRRAEAMERVLAAIPPERHNELHAMLKGLDGYVNVREGRAYWQLVIAGEMRGLLLRVGAELVRQGRLDSADDVFFVTPDDISDSKRDIRSLASTARAEWEVWRKKEAPAVIGTPGENAANIESKRAEFRGAPASRGVATGAVRIIRSPEEGDALKHGEILVCQMTTPAWTPLFAIAAGIITETGGALSHPAITAREYGIPAVVALPDATSRLRDGQIVTIDGGAGTVVAAS